jgi:hypothetical protein
MSSRALDTSIPTNIGFITAFAPTPQPILARCGLLVPGDCTGLCVLSERGNPSLSTVLKTSGRGSLPRPDYSNRYDAEDTRVGRFFNPKPRTATRMAASDAWGGRSINRVLDGSKTVDVDVTDSQTNITAGKEIPALI